MNSSTERHHVAVIGLGAMGLPIAKNLIRAGFDVQVWNRTKGPDFESGGVVADTISQIDAHIILSVLPDLKEVREILENGLRNRLQERDILVIMGTVSPKAVRDLASELQTHGIIVVDSPMSGGVVGAQNASMSLMVGCSSQTFNEIEQVLKAVGKTVIRVGEVGSGQLAKASNQIIVALNLIAICEAIALAERSGLNLNEIFELLSQGYAGSKVMDQKREMIISKNFTPGGKAKFMMKDLDFALEAARIVDLELTFTRAAREIYSQLINSGMGDLDIGSLYSLYE